MANTIRIKRRTAAGAAGAPASLATSELAYNEADNTLYVGYGDNGSGVATSVKALGGEGTFVTLGTNQTVSGNKTLTGTLAISGATDFSTVPTISGSIALNDSSTKIATTKWVKDQLYLTGNQTITVSGDATGSGTTAITLTLANTGVAAGTYTKVTVNTKGLVTSATTLIPDDIPTLLASKISDFDTQVRTNRLDQMAAPTTAVSLNSQRVTNLADPVNAQDAATKNYVDTAVQGLDIKQSVRTASSGDVTIASPGPEIGGVTLNVGDRVLLLGQTAQAQNGIYVFNGATSPLTRALDANATGKLTAGSFTFVEEGTLGNNGYVVTTDEPITLGTSPVVWVQFSGAGQITAGDGLAKSGNELSAVVDNVTLAIVNDAIQIKSTYVGQTSINTLGTISTGTWQAGIVGLAYGGTGSDLSATATGAIYKKGSTGLVAAIEGTDYLSASSTIYGGTF